MQTYNVSVPFGPVVFQTIYAAGWTTLPPAMTVGPLEVTEVNDLTYRASLTVNAQSASHARDEAVSQVRLFLELMAVRGDAFTIRFGERLTVSKQDRVSDTSSMDILHSDPTDSIEIVDVGIGVSAVDVLKRGDYSIESAVMASGRRLPQWVTTALELNYQAVITRDLEASLLIRFAALDLISEQVFGERTSLLKRRIDKSERSRLRELIADRLCALGISNDEVKRLWSGFVQTDDVPKSERIARALTDLGVEVTPTEVSRVTSVRGSIAHSGAVSDRQTLIDGVDRTRDWVQSALAAILKDCRC